MYELLKNLYVEIEKVQDEIETKYHYDTTLWEEARKSLYPLKVNLSFTKNEINKILKML